MKKKEKSEPIRKKCLKCEKERPTNRDFYLSNSENHSDHRYPICKQCLKESLNFDEKDGMSDDSIDAIQKVLLEMNRPFLFSLWASSVEESERTNKDLLGLYMKNVMLNFKTYTWKQSEFNKSSPVEVSTIENEEGYETEIVTTSMNRDKQDVIRMLGYDPFEFESTEDKKYLYNRLVDFLDESALEDGFKLQAVIEIVKGFNQIDKINRAITNITNDVSSLASSSGGIKALITSKKDILSTLLKLAEDNGISVKHNNQKSKGAGTLSGIIKTLQEKGFEQSEINLFDIETAKGIRQVADLSNQSIVAQLQFDENDYNNMLIEQREIIQELDTKVIKLEEENRLLKKELMKLKTIEGGGMNE